MILTPDKIKTAREAKGMSRQDLADAIGTSEKSIQYYESGQNERDLENLKEISNRFAIN